MNLKINPADLEACGLELSPEIVEKTGIYVDLLFKWAGKVNLTSVKDREELLRFHILEAYWAANRFRNSLDHFVDIGSGAGFPGMAMKIVLPTTTRATLIEPNFKKAAFLSTINSLLDLGVRIFEGKAEDFRGWEGHKAATVRALKPSSEVLGKLREIDCRLLVFRGNINPVEDVSWIIRQESRFPLSKNRFVSLLIPKSGG